MRFGFNVPEEDIPNAVTAVRYEVRAATQSGTQAAGSYGFTVHADGTATQLSGARDLTEEWTYQTAHEPDITGELSATLNGTEIQMNGASLPPNIKLSQVRIAVDYDARYSE